MSIEDPAIIPLAVISAIFLFVLREVIEGIRRYKSNTLKLDAIRALLAAECERNNFSILRMVTAIESMSTALEQSYEIVIDRPFTPRETLRIMKPDGLFFGIPIPKIHIAILERHLFETASLSAGLFQRMRAAQDALSELQHVRDGIVTYPTEEADFLDGFLSFAAEEIEEHIEAVRDLYFFIECEPLTKTRIR